MTQAEHPQREVQPTSASDSALGETAKDQLQSAVATIRVLAHGSTEHPEQLLDILRALEKLHQEIREDLFQDALPRSRHTLFELLREMETHGGWPYIPRMRLQEVMVYLTRESEAETGAEPPA